MYLEIITEDDLENHPYFDRKEKPFEPPPDAEPPDEMLFVLSQPSYDEAVAAAKRIGLAKKVEPIAGLIQASQHHGQFLVSARLRVVGDIANGDDARRLWDGLRLTSWLRLLELADAWHAGQVNEEEAAEFAARAAVEPESVPALLDLLRRFVRLEPETGRYITAVARASLATSPSPETRVGARGSGGSSPSCSAALRRLRRRWRSPAASSRPVAPMGQAESIFANLCRVRTQLGKGGEAVETTRCFLALAGSAAALQSESPRPGCRPEFWPNKVALKKATRRPFGSPISSKNTVARRNCARRYYGT